MSRNIVKVLDKGFSDIAAGEKMLISSPEKISEFIFAIPKGSFFSIKELRRKLAQKVGADNTCPVTTGIFLRIVSEAAYEDFLNGEKNITPFWRVVDHESKTASKLACGIYFIKKRRRKEGAASSLPTLPSSSE